MKQDEEQYWPQHKVFFIATLALFPDKLNGHELNQLFYRPYLVGDNPSFTQLKLEEYRKAGYLKYEKPGALYKITDINTEKATKDLTQYLKKWQHNELLWLPADKPPDATYQQTLLIDAIARVYANQKEPRITPKDVYGKPNSDTYKPPFWELVLSCQLLDKKVKIKYMDYDRRIDGLYDDKHQPVVEFKLINKEFEQAVARRATLVTTSTANPPTDEIITTRSYDPDNGMLFFRGHKIQIILQKSRRGKTIGETIQGGAMRKLFKDVNTLRNGAPLHAIISVRKDNFDNIKRKLATNHLDEINRKIKEETSTPKLIIYDQVNYYIDKSYLG
ncbi:MAG: hypothetical protein WDZ34_00895 [Candidatus Saccharimonadales bacterium]